MEFITWTEDLNVGVNQINEEHKSLIGFINRLNHALQSGGAQKTMEEILLGLVKYTHIHFQHEEELMMIYDYPQIKGHREEHEFLKKKVAEFHERFQTGKATFSLELMSFLREWLISHIKGTDMKYREFFAGKGLS